MGNSQIALANTLSCYILRITIADCRIFHAAERCLTVKLRGLTNGLARYTFVIRGAPSRANAIPYAVIKEKQDGIILPF